MRTGLFTFAKETNKMSFTPEIINGDPLYQLIVDLVEKHRPKTILEIGSANGMGSTQAFIEGIAKAQISDDCKMVCLEANKDRFSELLENTKNYPFIECINASSVPVGDYLTEEDIDEFMGGHGYEFNIKRYSSETVKGWRRDEICSIVENNVSQSGLIVASLKLGDSRTGWDMVLIDGSAFTGDAEYDIVHGSGVIIMDDVMDIKCWKPTCKTMADSTYRQIILNKEYRNGYAAFRRYDLCE